jgi:hypothetical protein
MNLNEIVGVANMSASRRTKRAPMRAMRAVVRSARARAIRFVDHEADGRRAP